MYLISYDLSNDRIRSKVAKELENYGLRVQYSVFECRISAKQLETLYKKIAKLVSEDEEGNVRIYNICARCEERIQTIGIDDKPGVVEDDIFII